ncbi:MAG: histidine phosphatase family protein [Leptospiraceae bacterium]
MELHIIRHTQTSASPGTCYGHTDPELPENHLQDFYRVFAELNVRCPDPGSIYSSPSIRCQSLAQFLLDEYQKSRAAIVTEASTGNNESDIYGITGSDHSIRALHSPAKLELRSSLMELNFGEWEGQNYNKIPQQELKAWMDDFVHRAPPGGESYFQLHERTRTFFEQFKQETLERSKVDQKPSIIVTHGGVIRCFLEILLETSLEKAFYLQVPYGSIFSFRLPDREQ